MAVNRMIAPGSTSAVVELRAALGDRVTDSPSALDLHGRDESVFAHTPPDAVVFPRTTDEVALIMRVCAAHDTPVIPFGTGSSVEGHILATRGGISVDTQLMDKILRISNVDLDATVQAGVRRTVLEQALGQQGLFFSVDPGADASLGGMASTGASGTNTVRYGTMKENVLGLRVVLADGRVIDTGSRARKSSAGYDLTHLFVGSEGTLGIITELTLRVRGIPEAISAVVCSFPSIEAAVTAALYTVQSEIPIARCELLDAVTMAAVNKHAQLDHPEAPTLFLEFHGTPQEVDEQARAVGEIAVGEGGSDFAWAADTTGRNRLWRARHNAYFAVLGLRPGSRAISTDACVPLSELAASIQETIADAAELPFPVAIFGHVADGNFHAVIVIDPDDDEESRLAERLRERIMARAIAVGGTCTGEHGIGLGKREALRTEVGPAFEVMRSLKSTLDPNNILNPDKIV